MSAVLQSYSEKMETEAEMNALYPDRVVLTEAEIQALMYAAAILELRGHDAESAIIESLLARAGATEGSSNEHD